MAECQVGSEAKAERLEAEASKTFDAGRTATRQSVDCILNTVILAAVLFLSDIASHFDWLQVRIAVVFVTLVLQSIGLCNMVTFPVK